MRIPDDRRYTRTHEWAKQEGELVRVGITDFAQDQLGDIVFVELPEVGKAVDQEGVFGVIESVKAVEDLHAPVGGEIVEVNAELDDRPEMVNEDPYGGAWLVVIRPVDLTEMDSLMGASAYEKHCEGEEVG